MAWCLAIDAVRKKKTGDKRKWTNAAQHAIARGFARPSLLAMILVEKYANHQPLNRQSEQFRLTLERLISRDAIANVKADPTTAATAPAR